MDHVWGRLQHKLPRRNGYPPDLETDKFAFLDKGDFEDVQQFMNMLDRGGTIEGPGNVSTFTCDAVATRPAYLHTADPHLHHFDARMEKVFRRGPYLMT